MVLAVPAGEVGTANGGTSLADIRHTVPPGVLVGGDPAQTVDETSATYGAFPLMFGLVALVTFVLLARGLRSILLPAKAVLLNALSVAAAYGLIVLVFQHGLGSQALWGMSATGSIDTYVPLLMFGFLFGISMDYEVFILSRVREAYNRVRSTDAAVVEGVSRTGRLVTSAALILCLALASLSTASNVTVRELAFGLASGVLLDAVVVRMLLLPALVSLFGEANWWLPNRARRLLRAPAPEIRPARAERVPALKGDD
jgi:RND superfamily putative drug exporter